MPFAAVIMMRAFCSTCSRALAMKTRLSTMAAIRNPTAKAAKIMRLNLALKPMKSSFIAYRSRSPEAAKRYSTRARAPAAGTRRGGVGAAEQLESLPAQQDIETEEYLDGRRFP